MTDIFQPFGVFVFLCRKAVMEKSYAFVMAFLMMVSCGIHETGESVRNQDDGIWKGPGMNIGLSDPDRTICYVTAMDYPDGYDWRADREKGSVKCSLIVYADGIPMMKIPVGDAYMTSSDIDMHRVIEGHLYTDYSTSDETIIKMDGKEIIRYPGREMICAMLVDGTDVHTLGHPRSGEGFSYRKNGEIVLAKDSGRSFSRLHKDNDSVCFAYCENILSVNGPVERYYTVTGGKTSQAALREDVKKVWDVMSYNGEVCYIASMIGVDVPVLIRGESMEALEMPLGMDFLTGRMSVSDSELCVEGVMSGSGFPLTGLLWVGGRLQHIFEAGMTVSSICVQGDGVSCMLNPKSMESGGRIYRCGELFDMPSGYVSMGGCTMTMVNGILNAGLSSLDGDMPLIWKDGVLDTLGINGYVTSVTAGRRL